MKSIRRHALEKLATLSFESPRPPSASSDLTKLCESCPPHGTAGSGSQKGGMPANGSISHVPMARDDANISVAKTFRELEVLLSLCRAASTIHRLEDAERVLQQIGPYVSESAAQVISPSPFLHTLAPSPWESLTFELVSAVLKIGGKHSSLRNHAENILSTYLEHCSKLVRPMTGARNNTETIEDHEGSSDRIIDTAVLATSLLGFLHAAAVDAHFWTPSARCNVIQHIQTLFSEQFMITCETSFSTIRTSHSAHPALRDWKQYMRRYAVDHRPLGAMLLQQGFMKLVETCASLCVVPASQLQQSSILKILMSKPKDPLPDIQPGCESIVGMLSNVAADELFMLDEGSDYLQIGSAWQQRVAHSARASSYITLLCCAILSEDDGDQDVLMAWLERVLADPAQVANANLACVALRCMAMLGKLSPSFASNLSRSLPQFLLQGPLPAETATVTADCLLFVLKLLRQDIVITTLYGLGNHLRAKDVRENTGVVSYLKASNLSSNGPNKRNDEAPDPESSFSLVKDHNAESSNIFSNVILAVVNIARGCEDEQVTALALSMLVQKVGRVSTLVDLKVIEETAVLAVGGAEPEFRSLLKLYVRLTHDSILEHQNDLLEAVSEARNYLGRTLSAGSPLFNMYLEHLLETIISIGDMSSSETSRPSDSKIAAQEMGLLLRPLASMATNTPNRELLGQIENLPSLQRDAWFNIVIHGFSFNSELANKYRTELSILACASRALIAEEHVDRVESDIELNTVLRRGMSPQNTSMEKKNMIKLLPQCESDIKSLDYPELIFLKAAHLVEMLRAISGDCTQSLDYFVDPDLKGGSMGNCMNAVALGAVDAYLWKTLPGRVEAFSAPFMAEQLSKFFEGCCHRISRVQQAAYTCAQRIIDKTPSALCQKVSIFTLLDLLTIMWSSCLEEEIDEYSWKSTYTSPGGLTTVQLSDDYAFRRYTLQTFHTRAKGWVTQAINIAPLDIKGLLQTYLSDHDDDRAYGHMSLGRSLALDMGAMIPLTDQRLGAIETDNSLNINTASDFVAQYTARQEYRLTDPRSLELKQQKPRVNGDLFQRSASPSPHRTVGGLVAALTHIEHRIHRRESVPHHEMRHTLRRAAAHLSGTRGEESSTLAPFMRIPFAAFTKESIKMGVSLWLGVIKENSGIESGILIEVIEGWITTIRRRLGIFSSRMKYVDPFYIKEEFAPSDKEAVTKRQQIVNDQIAPHYRVLQALSSHYNATRLSSPSVEKAYHRFLNVTLRALRHTMAHPLTREVHFHVVLLALKFLRFSTSLDVAAQWRLKDSLLSAGLAWFAHPPRWSFGGNRVQLKAETQLLADVEKALATVMQVGATPNRSLHSLQTRHDLLNLLVQNEQARLVVWLFPLGQTTRYQSKADNGNPPEATITRFLPAAWAENPGIAINLAARFSTAAVTQGVRRLLLESTSKALNEPNALGILLENELPVDVTSQLKYLLYWTPANPITAATYFLPAYKNHPFLIQYAIRALESHSVDITFFYVPQIVQALRYDDLGYVERYIIETAKFSQLFAHQIIWNMKANAYKDEDSEIPDSVKPTLDKVTDSLINSFSAEDRQFYHREFDFFNEITGISGKLRPFIKAPKPEKKQKIEEELRQIHVEVGVYLPSNPDGVVVGIDRKSGKPLQSHAKAPYMATFRIRKEVAPDEDASLTEAEDTLAAANNTLTTSARPTYEVWQSAIFKVGDDCRQDLLALQMMACFRGIYQSVGLDVYLFPYRVTATAPGCGVIDVLPAALSRDMLGREAVNGLLDYFVSRHGAPDSIAYQAARTAFVKSMAGYSVISYLLQFKDRHNGNIMVDDTGHILHVDFGFCFDIAPGGVRFERAPFKLTSEMVAVMTGGASTATATSQAYRWFEELCVKAFLAARAYVDPLAHVVRLMLDSGLPCFKPESLRNFRARFVLGKSEREAAEYMRGLVRVSKGALSTKGYDEFQLLTNGIPY